MNRKRAAAGRKPPSGDGILLRYREKDTAYGVTRKTTTRLAKTRGFSRRKLISCAPSSRKR